MAFRRYIILVAALALTTLATQTRALCTSQQIGTITFHNCDDRHSGTSQQIGGTAYHNFGGQMGTSQQIGGTTYHNFGGQTGTSRQIGGTTYHNW